MRPFTPQELAEMAAYDAQVERLPVTRDEIAASRKRDRVARVASMENRKAEIAEYHRAYYEANKAEIAEYNRAYREANKANYARHGAKLRAIRQAHGLTQAALAKLSGVTQGSISKIEAGKLPPTPSVLSALENMRRTHHEHL